MKSKDKAKELFNKFCYAIRTEDSGEGYYTNVIHAKQCALIAVDITIITLNEDIKDIDVRGNILLDLIDYWKEVKNEIEKL